MQSEHDRALTIIEVRFCTEQPWRVANLWIEGKLGTELTRIRLAMLGEPSGATADLWHGMVTELANKYLASYFGPGGEGAQQGEIVAHFKHRKPAGRRPHLVAGRFQSDKYPWCKRGFVPLKITDESARGPLETYARRHREIDPEFSEDLIEALRIAHDVEPAP